MGGILTVVEVSAKEYALERKQYCTVFDLPEFAQLNSVKCERIHYLFFNDSKKNLGLILGAKAKELLMPFSAPHAFFSWIKTNPKLSDFSGAVQALDAFGKDAGYSGITITLPPFLYHEDHITKALNSFVQNGYSIDKVDLNQHLAMEDFPVSYLECIDSKARQKTKAGLSQGLVFSVSEGEQYLDTAFSIITANREYKGHPIRMTLGDLYETSKLIKILGFTLSTKEGDPIAAAVCYEVSTSILHVVFWGNLPGTDDFKPMNVMAYKLIEYCKLQGYTHMDIGISTDNGVPNFGLSDFKQSIGCRATPKFTLSKRWNNIS